MIKSVLKAIKILQLFDETQTRMTLSDISTKMGMPKSTVHNLLNTLLTEGYIEKVDGDQYALGTAPLALSQNIRVNIEIRDPAAPLLRKLSDQTRETVMLTIRDGDYVLYIYAIESSQRLLARTAVGERAPFHCTAVGKAMLAFMPENEVEDILSRVGLSKFTERTITEFEELKAELEKTRGRGYSIDSGEHEEGTYCVGAPILDRQGNVIAACSLSGIDQTILTARLDELANLIMKTGEEISRRMGYVPSPRYR